jgi:uncharacterized protein DUF6518
VLAGPVGGAALGAVDSVANHVPSLLGEVGAARADRSGWSQAAEFASLNLDAGWAWAAMAVLLGWLVSRDVRPTVGMKRAALAGGLTLVFATAVYYGVDVLFDGSPWWDWVTRFWLIGSVLFGPLLGIAGVLIRRPGPVGVLAALLVPVGASLQMVILPPPAESRMAVPVRLAVWIVAGAAVLLIGYRAARVDPPVT